MAIQDELEAINAGFGEAFATQDAERLASFYADEARLLLHGQPIIRGRAAVDAALRNMVEGGPASLRFVTDEVIEGGSLVVDVGRIVGLSGQSKLGEVARPDGSDRGQGSETVAWAAPARA